MSSLLTGYHSDKYAMVSDIDKLTEAAVVTNDAYIDDADANDDDDD